MLSRHLTAVLPAPTFPEAIGQRGGSVEERRKDTVETLYKEKRVGNFSKEKEYHHFTSSKDGKRAFILDASKKEQYA